MKMIHTKFGACRTNRFEVIQFLVIVSFSSAAILDFEKWRFCHFRCLVGVKTKLHAKFGENRTNVSGDIKVFVNFNMAAGAILDYEFRDFETTCLFRVQSR